MRKGPFSEWRLYCIKFQVLSLNKKIYYSMDNHFIFQFQPHFIIILYFGLAFLRVLIGEPDEWNASLIELEEKKYPRNGCWRYKISRSFDSGYNLISKAFFFLFSPNSWLCLNVQRNSFFFCFGRSHIQTFTLFTNHGTLHELWIINM